MKDNWEKVREPLILDENTIREMVKTGFGERVTCSEILGGGLSNSNYLISLEGMDKPIVLRIYSGTAETCQKETEISRLVHDTVPVPEVYATGVTEEKPFALVEWIEGTPLNKAMKQMSPDELDKAAYHIGRVLADIHRYRFDKPGFFGQGLEVVEPLGVGEDMFRSFMEESLYRGKAGEWLGEEKTEQFWRFVNKNAKFLEETPDQFSLTHSDFNPWNLLIDESMNVAAVLDWEFAFSASAVHDIGNMLRFEPDGSPFEQRFIEGFAAGGGELPEEWRKLSKLNDLIAIVDLLNRSDSGENRIADLKNLIEGTMMNW